MKRETEKIIIVSYILIAVFILLVMRLWQLQVLEGDEYRNLSEANRLRITNIHAPRGILFDRNGIPLVKNSPSFTASLTPGEFDIDKINALSDLLNIPSDEILTKIRQDTYRPFSPISLKQGISFQEVAYIEARKSDFPGIIIEVEVSREYLYGNVSSHLLGYLGKLTPSQSKDSKFKDIPLDTYIGQSGVEKLFDNILRGIPGKRVIEVNALGREIRLLKKKPPIKGDDLTLSIDINLLKEADTAFGDRAGALVAIKPGTGEILGMLSKPSFNPSSFSKGMSHDEWKTLAQDKRNPLLNRALQSRYPPGSTFKIVTAFAALEEGVISPETKINCKGGTTYGKWHFGCWRKHGHGVISLEKAIVESCDVYFYELGKRLGIDKIHSYAVSLGLGEKTGIELAGEKAGLIPNSKWKLKEKKLPWYTGETFIAAIGQGYVSVTPVQLAVMTNTIANGGNIYKPTLLKDTKPITTGKVQIKPDILTILRKSLSGVVNAPSGTGWAAKSDFVHIGGKTGTAQVVTMKNGSVSLPEKFRDHAWFVAFAPVENPEIAIAVLVEHGGHGGSAAAPIAKKAIEAYLKQEVNSKTPVILNSN